MTTINSARGLVSPPRSAPHSTLPASPTLTNPDMILPDYDRSPSPVGLDNPSTHLQMWRNAQVGQALGNINTIHNGPQQQFHGFSAATPTTPIIYGNGTMLSDIGEVTEAESTPGKSSPPSWRPGVFQGPSHGLNADNSEGDAALRSSPTVGKTVGVVGIKKRAKEHAAQRERRNSTDSNSTITDDRERPAAIADFDDTVSVGDSVFQGDDEESTASSYVDDSSIAHDVAPTRASLASGLNGQKYSTAQLSRRAEQILANAKKRLTTMEDNLTRARSSLLVASPLSGSDGSIPSPPIVRASSALIQSTTGPVSPASGHHRIGSDNSLRIGIPIKVYPQRSSSVLGVSNGTRHQGLTVSKSADQLNGQYDRQRPSYVMREASLEPLGEDDASHSAARGDFTATKRYSSRTSPTGGTLIDRGLSRSASVTHMRDIKDQVRDLKGKVSSLREQARADSMKRRSLQSLRTPSPFTHAEISQWHNRSAEPEPKPEINTSEVAVWNGEMTGSHGGSPRDEEFLTPNDSEFDKISPIDAPALSEDLDGEMSDQFNYDTPGWIPYQSGDDSADDDNDDLLTENGDVEDEIKDQELGSEYDQATDDGYDMVSESGESIYHESVQHQISHEDREDAFDYEHFFLHSAMGTLSQRVARRGSRGSDSSFTSEDSVQTTRGPLGPVAEEEDTDGKQLPLLSRRASEASISTIDTFATANEEDAEDDHESSELAKNDEEYQGGPEAFPTLEGTSNAVEGATTPPETKRTTFGSVASSPYATQIERRGSRQQEDLYSAIRRSTSSNAVMKPHRPSVSSFESTGTTRSFPLVKKSSKLGSPGMATPEHGSSDPEVKTISSSQSSTYESQTSGSSHYGHKHNNISIHSTNSATSIMQESGTAAVMETLPRDDQFLVERLVASLGRCVLGMTESGRASTEARMYRRRIDAARKILEGLVEPTA